MTDLNAVAARVDDAARYAEPIAQLTDDAGFSLDEAYDIQRASIERRIHRGESMVGVKLGFTSRAKMVQMGVDSLIWGWLTDTMLEEDGGRVLLDRFIHPRVEPEVCFLTSREIDRPLTLLEAASYLDAVAPAMEIIDSRYRNFKFTLEDVVADNCSSAGLVIGPWTRRFDGLRNAGVLMRMNGRAVQVGSTAAILGDPLRSVVQASRLISQSGLVLPAGSLIMAGAATAAEALPRGAHVQCVVNGLSTTEFTTY
ncbi:4-oxalocrotonate decarboxylase [Ralstonia insidiosa]|uniref:4-oxalocrotonate decarboxylase n=1 Tax=Ralstonia insidiosa TaxID=190721 RepID=A0AAC9BLJ0_9RALS|nr:MULTISPECIES: fumarylacetoacetate hydrolase family protein [Ralstonia]ANH76621.1 4-oxalocrotonate decarboxylase [Ralstonia insidiosa]EPX98645.1 4-oxalocrotonate decarboxylase [Ralstonia sp. AU12-08]MBY4705997.1 fumarylacetoacetate hydrolase family protein [Ralstonia insidiosa]GAQ27045.1 4-oxalocrotonate decarboxylase [Ralstonia sp. NT80]